MRPLFSPVIMAAAAVLLISAMPAHADSSKLDSRIESSAKQSYVFKTYLKNDTINIKSSGGVVTLSGSVNENFHKAMAQETVADLPGVISVDNRLETKDATAGTNSDAWLRDKIKVTLSFHRSVSAIATEIDVKDGIVTLRGVASSTSQKDLTGEYVKDVEGVKEVRNEMTVVVAAKKNSVGETIDDSSITAQVKMALLYHRSTSALHTSVKTDNGKVTLDGTAKNVSEKELATKFAKDVHGVKEVSNRMIIE